MRIGATQTLRLLLMQWLASGEAAQPSLKDIWLQYSEPHLLHRVLHYADHYQTHLPERGRDVKLFEIGVQSGGSARTWKQYYGKHLYYVGLDINPKTVRTRSKDENIFVEIGSQANASLLLDICKRHGPFDVVVDDGGHTPHLIAASLKALFPSAECMATDSVYVVEDTCTMMGTWFTKNPADMYGLAGEAWWSMHGRSCTQTPRRPCCIKPNLNYDGKGAQVHPTYGAFVTAVHLYESLMFIVRGVQKDAVLFKRGHDEIPYKRRRR